MKEKELIKQALDMDLPDFEKVKTNIVLAKSNRSTSEKRFIWIFACLSIIILSILIIPNFINQLENISQNGTSDLEVEPVDDPPIEPESNNHIVFNTIDETETEQSKLYFDPEKTYKKELTVDEVIKYLGMDVRPTKVPDGLREFNPDRKFTILYNNDDTVAYDHFVFSYNEDFQEYNPLEKQLQVHVSKQGFVIDYVILFDDEMDQSKIGGQELLLGKRKMAYGPYTPTENGANIPAGSYDLFVAKFNMNGIYFEVVANNFTEDEFVETLASIIN